MAIQTQTVSPANFLALPCGRCGAKELQQRKPKRLLHRLSSVDLYVCARCGHRTHEVRLTLWTVPGVIFCAALIGAIVYFSAHITTFRWGPGATSPGATEAMDLARASVGGLSTFEQMMIKKPRSTLDNATVLRLWRANVGPNIILQLIRTSNADYDVSANSIIELKEAGVDQSVILAIIDASYDAR
jgi:hypothetical protein